MSLTPKQAAEQAAFAKFVRRTSSAASWRGVTSRPEPEPDLLCEHVADGPVAFEVVSLTDPLIAVVQAAGAQAHTDAFFTSDPSERIVRKKLTRSYKTTATRIELLIYANGQLVTPDDVIVPTILPLLQGRAHPFARIWFMGENTTCCLFGAG